MIKFGGKGILLDIEGTTSSIRFVHDVMFPFVRQRLESFLSTQFHSPSVQSACEQIARDAGHASLQAWRESEHHDDGRELIQSEVVRLMDIDAKATGLKALQGIIWQAGFDSGELRAHVYPEVVPAIQRWRAAGKDVRMYSSGSVAAQKLFFGQVENWGNCLDLFSGHYDTTIGSKKHSPSYSAIAQDWRLEPAEILFISDVSAELTAAAEAGFQIAASIRPENDPIAGGFAECAITSFDQIELL